MLFNGYTRVAERTSAADGIVVLELEAEQGGPLPTWKPGAHIDVHFTEDLVRQYSLCGELDHGRWRIGVLHQPEGRGGSQHVHGSIRAGDRLRVSEPRNNFHLVDAESYLFIAGGIGITPILPMIAAATRRGVPWELVYSGRSLASMAFLDELAPFGDRVRLVPRDSAERVDLAALLTPVTTGRLAYACGPQSMMDDVVAAASHWPADSVRTERFHPEELGELENSEIEIELAASGGTLTVPADRSILHVLAEHGIFVETSCGEGICGSCEVTVLDGVPEHRDTVLSQAERDANESMMVCVSRCAARRLVLDL